MSHEAISEVISRLSGRSYKHLFMSVNGKFPGRTSFIAQEFSSPIYRLTFRNYFNHNNL